MLSINAERASPLVTGHLLHSIGKLFFLLYSSVPIPSSMLSSNFMFATPGSCTPTCISCPDRCLGLEDGNSLWHMELPSSPRDVSWSNQAVGDDHLSPYNLQHNQKWAVIPLPKMLFPSFDDECLSVPPPLAPHDPRAANTSSEWVQPQFIIKADDDSFVMLLGLKALSDVTSKGTSGH